MQGFEEIFVDVKSTEDFLQVIFDYTEKYEDLKCYRGQGSYEWKNIPSLLRDDNAQLLDNEKSAIRELITIHPEEFSKDGTMFDRLVRMQHFGLPTRLLDVTRNPLIALYFATDSQDKDGSIICYSVPEEKQKFYDSDTISCLANLSNLTAKDKDDLFTAFELLVVQEQKYWIRNFNHDYDVSKRLLHFIRQEKPYFEPKIDPSDLLGNYYVHPKLNNPRIIAQSGGFMMFGLFYDNTQSGKPILEYKIRIPAKSKTRLRREIELLGITDSAIFPDLERAAKRIRSRYSNFE
ncbi:FRG domain-containing protein [Asaia sp. HN128]|uniref:FRG domain-containing protein n=1 Tax=Asaia sp. HN128 TaxID=3081234 RepID=UPI003016CAB8